MLEVKEKIKGPWSPFSARRACLDSSLKYDHINDAKFIPKQIALNISMQNKRCYTRKKRLEGNSQYLRLKLEGKIAESVPELRVLPTCR